MTDCWKITKGHYDTFKKGFKELLNNGILITDIKIIGNNKKSTQLYKLNN